ncbi:MAG: hypothetical protein U5L08_06250 [Xanthomonadales bacterium]|nr:hypothetical protein [Xanthomonadales bacterium]
MERGNEIEEAEQKGAKDAVEGAACEFCGEPRGDVTPCPHCGMQ